MTHVPNLRAEFSQLGRDLYWTIYFDGKARRWTGYDDGYWWSQVAPSHQFRKLATESGVTLELDPASNVVTITDPKETP